MVEEGLRDVIPDLYQGLPQLEQCRRLVLKTAQSSFHCIPHMFYGRKIRQNRWLGKCGNVLLCEEVSDHSSDVRMRVILLKCDVMSMNLQEREDMRTENFLMEPNSCQIAIKDLQLGPVMFSVVSLDHHASTAE